MKITYIFSGTVLGEISPYPTVIIVIKAKYMQLTYYLRNPESVKSFASIHVSVTPY